MDYRVLITGSRDWPDSLAIVEELYWLLMKHESLVVVHGACPKGADRMADEWAMSWQIYNGSVTPERHPADWDKHGKAAGFIRNQEMVDAGADFYLAFIKNHSRGATDCLDRLIKARIPGRVFEL